MRLMVSSVEKHDRRVQPGVCRDYWHGGKRLLRRQTLKGGCSLNRALVFKLLGEVGVAKEQQQVNALSLLAAWGPFWEPVAPPNVLVINS